MSRQGEQGGLWAPHLWLTCLEEPTLRVSPLKVVHGVRSVHLADAMRDTPVISMASPYPSTSPWVSADPSDLTGGNAVDKLQ